MEKNITLSNLWQSARTLKDQNLYPELDFFFQEEIEGKKIYLIAYDKVERRNLIPPPSLRSVSNDNFYFCILLHCLQFEDTLGKNGFSHEQTTTDVCIISSVEDKG